jgi:hypothetical protein
MKLRIVTLPDIRQADIEAWSDLRDRAITPYPCLDPRLLVPASRLRGDARGTQLIFVEDNEQLLAAMPFVVRRGVGGLPTQTISTGIPFLQLESGWQHPLVDQVRAVDAITALLTGASDLHLPPLLDLCNVPGDGPLFTALHEAVRRLGLPMVERERQEAAVARRVDIAPQAPTEPGRASFVVPHSATRTRKRSKQARALEKALGAELMLHDVSEDPRAVEQFVELQNRGWKGDRSHGGGGLRALGFDRWFTVVTDAYRAAGDLTVHQLRAGDETVYAGVFLRIGTRSFGYADAYDERFASYSAGTLGRIASLNHTMADPSTTAFDPNMGLQYADAAQLYPHRQQYVRLLIATGGGLGRAVVRSLPAARRLRSRMAIT